MRGPTSRDSPPRPASRSASPSVFPPRENLAGMPPPQEPPGKEGSSASSSDALIENYLKVLSAENFRRKSKLREPGRMSSGPQFTCRHCEDMAYRSFRSERARHPTARPGVPSCGERVASPLALLATPRLASTSLSWKCVCPDPSLPPPFFRSRPPRVYPRRKRLEHNQCLTTPKGTRGTSPDEPRSGYGSAHANLTGYAPHATRTLGLDGPTFTSS